MNYFIKSKLNSFNVIVFYYINISLLLIYSIYKNGYLLYRNNLVSFISMFKPLILILLSIGITYFIDYLFSKEKYSNIFKEDYNPMYISLVVLALPLNINIFQLLVIISVFNIINNLINIKDINVYNILKLIIIGSIFLLGYYEYKNMYELSIDTSINMFDMFLGRSIGGMGTTNHLLLIITYIIFMFLPSYKREIPMFSFITYIIILVISLMFNNSFISSINDLINGEFLYGIIFIATIPNYSYITIKDRVIFGILIGIFSFISIKIINPFEGVFVGIFIANLIMYSLYKVRKVIHESK